MKQPLYRIAHARSGDKGDGSNVGLIANGPALYPVLVREVTAARVKQHFREVCHGEVERYEVPNLLALNFILHDSLGGGGTLSLKTDAQGKTHGQGLLMMEIEVPAELIPTEHHPHGPLGWETLVAPGHAVSTHRAAPQPSGVDAAAASPEAMKGE
jgi:hypothetical protein